MIDIKQKVNDYGPLPLPVLFTSSPPPRYSRFPIVDYQFGLGLWVFEVTANENDG